MEKRPLKRINVFRIILFIVLTAVLVLTACQSEPNASNEAANAPEQESAPPTAPPTEVPTQEPAPIPDQSTYYTAWESGAHNTYDLYHGPNTWCARCHSPQNWDPEAVPGTPPNCFSCKFPTDEEVRISDGNDLILEEDWVGINCAQCHMVDENGTANEIAWLNPISMEYIDVNTTTELCEKCHVTTTGNSFGSAVDHKITLGGSAHLNYGGFIGEVAPPQYCSDCHDPHTTEPLACTDCHDVASSETHAYVNGMLAQVSCMACHDAEGYDVGPNPDDPENGLWTTTLTEQGRSGPTTSVVVSHSIVHEVLCTRCHFEENPWELPVLTDDGQIPEPADEG
jgi:mono/diheme cytochrome c family protein